MHFDTAKGNDKPAVMDVRMADAGDSGTASPLVLEVASKPPQNSAGPGMEVKDIGQVADIKLPAGFVVGKQTDAGNGSNGSFREFHSAADPDVKVFFEYRGHRMTQDSSDNFHQLLAAPPHNLKQAEIDKLGEVIGDKSNPDNFQITTAKTQDVNGKRVLVVEGDYSSFPLRARTLYVDSDGSGSAVQTVTFQAPVDRYNKNIGRGNNSLESISWK